MNIEAARKLRREQTEAERLLWCAVRRAQIEAVQFRRQQPIGPFIADFFCPAAKLIVELDGSPHDNDSVHVYDTRRSGWLESRGYRVMQFQNEEVKANLDGVVETIHLAIRERRAPLPGPPPQGGRGKKRGEGDQ